MPTIDAATNIDSIRLQEQGSAPSTPPSGYFQLYSKDDGKLYGKNDAGTEYDLTSVAAFGTGTDSELTISSGAVTATGSAHTIDTESDAASDDLDTISGGTEGDLLVISANNAARTVVVKHGTGNILTFGGSDVDLDETRKTLLLHYDGSNWRVVGAASAGGGMTSFTAAGDSGGGQSIANGNTLTIAGGDGVVTADSATDTVTVSLDINSLTAQGSPTGASDYVAIYDAGEGDHRKVLLNDLPGGGGGMTSFDVDADSGTAETVGDGNTLTIAGGTGISTAVSATDTVTVNIDSTVATLTGSQTLTNKTLTTPTIGDFTNATHDHSNAANGGQIDTTGLADDAVTAAKLDPGAVNSEIMLMAQAANLPTGVAAPARDTVETATASVPIPVLAFDSSANETAFWSIVMPDDWDGGNITATIYWSAESSSGAVKWDFGAAGVSNDDALNIGFTANESVTDTLTATGDLCITSATSGLTPDDSSEAGDLVFFRIYRDATDGGDTLSADAQLIAVKIDYTRS
jgi:hypothetical protein